MLDFNIGETVVCSITVLDDGTLTDPATSMKIVIGRVNPSISQVTSTAMSKDSTGTYHYNAQTSGWHYGTYQVTYTATDGTSITIEKDMFNLE